MKSITYLIAVAATALIFFVHRSFEGITIYNLAPIILSLLPLILLKSISHERIYSVYGFSIVTIIFSSLFHLHWLLTSNASSTAGLIFIFLPLYSIGAGCIGAVIGTAIGLRHEFRKRNTQPGVVADLSRLHEPYGDKVNPNASPKAGASAPGS